VFHATYGGLRSNMIGRVQSRDLWGWFRKCSFLSSMARKSAALTTDGKQNKIIFQREIMKQKSLLNKILPGPHMH